MPWLVAVISCLLITHDKVVIGGSRGQLQCSEVPATYDNDLDLSSFSVSLDRPSDGVGNAADGSSSEGRQCKLRS